MYENCRAACQDCRGYGTTRLENEAADHGAINKERKIKKKKEKVIELKEREVK